MKKTTFVKEVFTENTGGNCMVDFVILKSGIVLTITDDCVCAFDSIDDFYEQKEPRGTIY